MFQKRKYGEKTKSKTVNENTTKAEKLSRLFKILAKTSAEDGWKMAAALLNNTEGALVEGAKNGGGEVFRNIETASSTNQNVMNTHHTAIDLYHGGFV